MERVDEIVYGIIKQSLFGEPFDMPDTASERIDDETVSKVYSELLLQTVLCFADKWIMEHRPADERLFAKWSEASKNYQIRILYVLSAQQSLVGLLKANGIKHVIIKGSAAAIYYPDPLLRMMGDVDVYVKREDFNRAAKLLEENGYVGTEAEHHDDDCHSAYHKNSVCIELHKRLPIVDEGNETLLAMFEKGIDESVDAAIECLYFPVLPEKLNGMVLLFHINQHLRSGLGLRQILDWMMFVERNIDDEAWKREYEPAFEELGMVKFAKTVTEMCKLHLGLGARITWCSDADHSVCEELLEYIMKKGNFGIKAGEEGHVTYLFFKKSNPFSFLKRLQDKGKREWSAAKKHAILRPFAWLYGIKSTIKLMKQNDLSVSDINELKNEGVRQRMLISALGLESDSHIYETDGK